MPRKSKAEPWEGDSSDDNNWEPEENLDGPDLIASFDDLRQKKDSDAPKSSTHAADEGGASRKRGGKRERKKKIEEIEKPRGVDRGLRPEKILAAQLFNSSVYFLVKWQDCLEFDVVPGKDMNQHYPEFVIQYYESCVPFSVRHKPGRVPRIAPELPPLEVPEPPIEDTAVQDTSMPDPAMLDSSMHDSSLHDSSMHTSALHESAMDVSDSLQPPTMTTEELAATLGEPAEQPTMPDMSLPDLTLPEVSSQPEPQSMEVPVN